MRDFEQDGNPHKSFWHHHVGTLAWVLSLLIISAGGVLISLWSFLMGDLANEWLFSSFVSIFESVVLKQPISALLSYAVEWVQGKRRCGRDWSAAELRRLRQAVIAHGTGPPQLLGQSAAAAAQAQEHVWGHIRSDVGKYRTALACRYKWRRLGGGGAEGQVLRTLEDILLCIPTTGNWVWSEDLRLTRELLTTITMQILGVGAGSQLESGCIKPLAPLLNGCALLAEWRAGHGREVGGEAWATALAAMVRDTDFPVEVKHALLHRARLLKRAVEILELQLLAHERLQWNRGDGKWARNEYEGLKLAEEQHGVHFSKMNWTVVDQTPDSDLESDLEAAWSPDSAYHTFGKSLTTLLNLGEGHGGATNVTSLRRLFDEIDTDGGGTLDRHEVRHYAIVQLHLDLCIVSVSWYMHAFSFQFSQFFPCNMWILCTRHIRLLRNHLLVHSIGRWPKSRPDSGSRWSVLKI